MTEEQNRRIANRDIVDPMQVGAVQTRGALVPQNAGEALEFAKIMAGGHFSVPAHLRNSPGDCMRILMIATRTGLDPFMLGDETFVVRSEKRPGDERLSFSAKAIQAIVETSGFVPGGFTYTYAGAGPTRKVTVSGHIKGQEKTYDSPKFSEIGIKNSPLWRNDPDQQLGYFAVRGWCRRHAPAAIMGLYSDDEPRDGIIDVTPEPSDVEKVAAVLEGGQTPVGGDDDGGGPAGPLDEEPATGGYVPDLDGQFRETLREDEPPLTDWVDEEAAR